MSPMRDHGRTVTHDEFAAWVGSLPFVAPGTSIRRWARHVKIYDDLSAFTDDPQTLTSGRHTVLIDSLPYDMLFQAGAGPLLIFLNGAVPRNENSCIPAFTGMSIGAQLSANILYVNDPSLYLSSELALSWYAGWRGGLIIDRLVTLITAAKERLGSGELIIAGGSGGGFASLAVASRISNSLAFVWNPQTYIAAYDERAVADFVRYCYAVEHPNELDLRSSSFDLRKLSRCGEWGSRFIYFQNRTDWHVGSHLRPFAEHIGAKLRDDSLVSRYGCGGCFILGDWGVGHAPLPQASIAAGLRLLLEQGSERFLASPEAMQEEIVARWLQARVDSAPQTSASALPETRAS